MPRNPNWNILWKTGEEWRAAANTQAAKTMQTLPASRQRLHVTTQPGTIGGVRIYTVTSGTIPPEHRDKRRLYRSHLEPDMIAEAQGEVPDGMALIGR